MTSRKFKKNKVLERLDLNIRLIDFGRSLKKSDYEILDGIFKEIEKLKNEKN